MNEIKRTFHKNRAGQYNGKITYSFTHEGKEITRTSKNHYINAAVVDARTQQEVVYSSKPFTEQRAIRQAYLHRFKDVTCTIYQVTDLGCQLQLNEDGKTYTLQGEKVSKPVAKKVQESPKKAKKVQKLKIVNREHWLTECAKLIEKEIFKPLGFKLPKKWRVACGFPSKSGLSSSLRRIGEHWNPACSSDKTHEIIISITLSDKIKVAGILAHELIHAVHPEDGHGSKFRQLALAIGLEGKMTATTEGPLFIENIKPILAQLGKYPHAVLDSSNRKKQGTRMIKGECECCGYTVRLTRKWLDVAIPICPDQDCHSFSLELEIS